MRTPPATNQDARRVGVRPTGTYWGAAGEQIDMQSGNLNFTLPVVKAVGRGGWTVPFNLTYNSQNWRQDAGGDWKIATDVGFGLGWKLLAGSLTPYWEGNSRVHHYLFTDATGAEYRLDQNSNGIWSSKESVFVKYDSTTGWLWFRDGMGWCMNVTSGGTEPDAGTMYPSIIQDPNGNYVYVGYRPGLNSPSWNSSSRIETIDDSRPSQADKTYHHTYYFEYGFGDPVMAHLVSIKNGIDTFDEWKFALHYAQPFTSPWGNAAIGSSAVLDSVTQGMSTLISTERVTSFSHSASGELQSVTTPLGGRIGWTYSDITYATGRKYRVVTDRTLAMKAGDTPLHYAIGYDCYSCGNSLHWQTRVDDPSGIAAKVWLFEINTNLNEAGLVKRYEELLKKPGATDLSISRQFDYNWSSEPATGNLYVSHIATTEGMGDAHQQVATTDQTLDQYGNVASKSTRDYADTGNGLRTYSAQYLNDPAYLSRYIANRPTSNTVTDGTDTITTSFSYDGWGTSCLSTGRCPALTDPTTPETPMPQHFSSMGTNATTRGLLTRRTDWTGATIFSYDVGGNMTESADISHSYPASYTATTSYNAPSAVTAAGLTSSLSWNAALNLTQDTGPNGETGSIYYTAGLMDHTVSATGAVTSRTYQNNVVTTTVTADGRSRWTRQTLDGFGRTILTESGTGSVTKSAVKTDYTPCGCSPLGKVWRVSMPYDPNASPLNIYYTTYEYDGLGRTTKVTAPDGSATTYDYDGNAVKVTDARGNWKRYKMNAFGELRFVEEPNPNDANAIWTTYYGYDVAGRLIVVDMPRPVGSGSYTQERTFNYKTNGQIGPWLVSATNPENGTVSYTYWPDGRVKTRTDAAGVVTSYAYDQVGLTSISYGGTVAATFTRGTAADFSAGRVKTVSYSTDRHSAVETYGYTRVGQVQTKALKLTGTYVLNGTSYNLTGALQGSWGYDGEGRITSATAPGGRQFTWTYDDMGRPSTMQTRPDENTPTWTDVVTGATYNEAGLPTAINYTAAYGGSSVRTYDPMTKQLTSMDGTTFSYGEAGQNNGQIQSETKDGVTVVYQYDKLKRLISAGEQTFEYDGFGNMTRRTGGPQPFGPLNIVAEKNQILGVSYTANGAMLSANGYSLTYDEENRLSTATGPGRTLNVSYAPGNQRIYQRETTTTTQETVWFWGVGGKVMAQCSVLPTTTAITFTCDSDPWAEFAGRRARQNRLGSVGPYYPYGEANGSGTSFATYPRDAGTGLDYAVNRWYSSAYTRFLTADPSRASGDPRNPRSWNRYSYVLGDPISFNDPAGLNAADPDGSLCSDGPWDMWGGMRCGRSGGGGGSQCTLEGIPVPCSLAQSMVDTGSGVVWNGPTSMLTEDGAIFIGVDTQGNLVVQLTHATPPADLTSEQKSMLRANAERSLVEHGVAADEAHTAAWSDADTWIYSGGHWNLVIPFVVAFPTFRDSNWLNSTHGTYRHGGYSIHVDCGNPSASPYIPGAVVHLGVDVIYGNIGTPNLDNGCLVP